METPNTTTKAIATLIKLTEFMMTSSDEVVATNLDQFRIICRLHDPRRNACVPGSVKKTLSHAEEKSSPREILRASYEVTALIHQKVLDLSSGDMASAIRLQRNLLSTEPDSMIHIGSWFRTLEPRSPANHRIARRKDMILQTVLSVLGAIRDDFSVNAIYDMEREVYGRLVGPYYCDLGRESK